ncbi:MAG: DUF4350 domain-containing protein [Acidobacteriota bacterium]|nr:DUF4350 domain-containing protein [Acidobacteriota bacterium]
MRQKFLIFLALIFLVILLVALNAATYVRKEKVPDNEFYPNRSTYNAGATGTRALYDLLSETGRRVSRWQEPFSALASNGKNSPSTFVVVGQVRREFNDKEIEQLLHWVSEGGKLVIIDREPTSELIKTTADWQVSAVEPKGSSIDVDPSDAFGIDSSNQQSMIGKTAVAKPVQPTSFTQKITAVQPSRLSSSIKIERFADGKTSTKKINPIQKFPSPPTPAAKPLDLNEKKQFKVGQSSEEIALESLPAPPPVKATNSNQQVNGVKGTISAPPNGASSEENKLQTPAPVVHLADGEKNLLVDFPFGAGQIVFLSDPYIVSNGGINLVDNAQLAVNILTSREGVISFDEYHQGFGSNHNLLFEYFSGTPVVAIFLQLAALIALILFAQSRRFARALPESEPNRLSKLEYVSAMAELQQRTKAFDLAIENIYTDFRRRAAKSFGVDNYAVSLRELARFVAERTNGNERSIENLMFKCEEIIRGEPTNKKEVLQIISRLRETEEKLGLQRRKTTRHRL